MLESLCTSARGHRRRRRKLAACGRQHAVIHVVVVVNMMDLIRGACGVRDGLIIGLPVTRLPCKAPPSVWRINFVILPPMARASHFIVKDQPWLSNSVSCLAVTKWSERKGGRKREANCSPVRLCFRSDESAQWFAYCHASAEWKHVQVRIDPPQSHPHLAPSPAQIDRSAAECPVMVLCWGSWGQCLAQGHFSSCYRGREEHYMVGLSTSEIQHKLPCFFLSFFITVRSKARHYVKLLIRPK